jgi:hypothetical protein
MAEDFGFDTNLMRFVAAQLHFLLSMSAAREMFEKSYFALGLSEKIAVDQAVSGNVAAKLSAIDARDSGGPASSATSGFWNPNRSTQAGKVIDVSPFGFCP